MTFALCVDIDLPVTVRVTKSWHKLCDVKVNTEMLFHMTESPWPSAICFTYTLWSLCGCAHLGVSESYK